MHSWTDEQPLRLEQLEQANNDPDPQALCCYGGLRRDTGKLRLRFVDGRPVSQVTTDFLEWICQPRAEESKKVWVLIWDNASWHKSQPVRNGIRNHNRSVKREGGVRIVAFRLPIKSPWRNPIEPHWVHGKRAVVEPNRTLAAAELISRVCGYFRCEHFEHLKQDVP
jgi:hypothetical protein